MTDELRAKFEATFPHLDFSADKYGNYYSQRTLDHLYGYWAAYAPRDAEVEALKRDAERYRWLRMSHEKFPSGDLDFTVACGYRESTGLIAVPSNTGMLDAEIDNAMAKESGE